MIFLCLILCLLVIILVTWPLLAKAPNTRPHADGAPSIYHDQLDQLDKECAEGTLASDEAEVLRTEIHRRLLSCTQSEITSGTKDSRATRFATGFIVAAFILIGSVSLYLHQGSPQLPGQPYAQRQNDPGFKLAVQADKLSVELGAHPDAEGLQHLGSLYFLLRRYDLAAQAYNQSLQILDNSAVTWSAMGEAIALSYGGRVVPAARIAFSQTLRLDPHDARARFYLGLREAQLNRPEQALAVWRDLERDSAAEAPWLDMLRTHIQQLAQESGLDSDRISPMPPALAEAETMPTTADADAMARLQPEERQEMIHAMVEKLAAKMKDNPNDKAGWERLAKAYRVLGDASKAEEAERKAAAIK